MPAGALQEEERFAGMHGSAREEVATATTVRALFKWMPVRHAHISAREALSARPFSLQLARLLGDVADQPTSRCRELSHVFICIAGQNVMEDVRDVSRVLDCHFVSHCKPFRRRTIGRGDCRTSHRATSGTWADLYEILAFSTSCA
jgi:hypothetical protein